MNLKKFITLSSAAIAATTMVAQAEVSIDLANVYVFRGATVSDEVSVQPGFETGIFGDMATVGTWANFNTDASSFDEIDYYVDYPLPLEASPVDISVGYTEYTYPTGATKADREFYLSFADDITETISADLLLAYGVDGAINRDFYSEFSIGSAHALADSGVEMNLGASIAYLLRDDKSVYDSGFSFADLSVGFAFQAASLDFTYIIETDDSALLIDEDFVVSLGFDI